MKHKYKPIPVVEISLDELRSKVDAKDDSTSFEYNLGLYCEIDTDSIGLKADLSRLFKEGFFTQTEKKAITKKLVDSKLDATERKAYQRALQKLRNYYLK